MRYTNLRFTYLLTYFVDSMCRAVPVSEYDYQEATHQLRWNWWCWSLCLDVVVYISSMSEEWCFFVFSSCEHYSKLHSLPCVDCTACSHHCFQLCVLLIGYVVDVMSQPVLLLIKPSPMWGGFKRCCWPSVCPFVCRQHRSSDAAQRYQ